MKAYDYNYLKLKRKEFSPRDINTAISLAEWIAKFHYILLPEEKVRFEFVRIKNDLVSYHRPKRNHRPVVYQIKVPGSFDFVMKESTTTPLFEIKGRNEIIAPPWEEAHFPSPEEMIKAIAAHEVRHRLQDLGIKMFSPEMKDKERDPLLRMVIAFVAYIKEVENDEKNGGYEKEWINDPKEFDALVIAYFILNKSRHCSTIFELVNLIKREPSLST